MFLVGLAHAPTDLAVEPGLADVLTTFAVDFCPMVEPLDR
jgi:hypothetical protein